MHVNEKDQPTQVIQFGQTAPAANEPDAVHEAENEPSTTIWRYFPLRRPIQLQNIRPTPEGLGPELMGYGEIGLTLQSDAEAIEIVPEVNVRVRLPSPSFVQQLPSTNLKQQIIDLKKDPNLFAKIAGRQGADNTWPEMIASQQDAMNELRGTIRAFKAQVENWHTQPLKKIILKKNFLSTFAKNSNDALKTIKATLPSLAKAVSLANEEYNKYNSRKDINNNHPDSYDGTYRQKLNQLDDAIAESQQLLEQALRYESAIPVFSDLLEELVTETEDSVKKIMQNYDQVEIILKEWSTAGASGEFEIRFLLLSPELPTPGAENGESVTVYFVDTSPQERTATVVPGTGALPP